MTFRAWLDETYPAMALGKYSGRVSDVLIAASDIRTDGYNGCLPDEAVDLGCILLHIITFHKPSEAAVKAICLAEQKYRAAHPEV